MPEGKGLNMDTKERITNEQLDKKVRNYIFDHNLPESDYTKVALKFCDRYELEDTKTTTICFTEQDKKDIQRVLDFLENAQATKRMDFTESRNHARLLRNIIDKVR